MSTAGTQWTVHIEAAAPQSAEPLGEPWTCWPSIRPARSADERSWSVTLTIESHTAMHAGLLAGEAVNKAVAEAGLPLWPITLFEVEPAEAAEAQEGS